MSWPVAPIGSWEPNRLLEDLPFGQEKPPTDALGHGRRPRRALHDDGVVSRGEAPHRELPLGCLVEDAVHQDGRRNRRARGVDGREVDAGGREHDVVVARAGDVELEGV